MAMEPLRRKKPTQTHPHHHMYYGNTKDPRLTKQHSVASQSISVSSSVPFSIVRYCARIAARSGLKAVFTPSTKPADRCEQTDTRPIHSGWYGRASMTPNEPLPPSKVPDNSHLHDTGIERWFEKAAVVNITPLIPCNSQGRGMESRRRSLKEVPVVVVQQDEDSDWREPADGEEASGEEDPWASDMLSSRYIG